MRCDSFATRVVYSYRAEGEAMGHGAERAGKNVWVCWFAKPKDSNSLILGAEVKRARARATIVRGRNKSARAGSNIMNRARARARYPVLSDLYSTVGVTVCLCAKARTTADVFYLRAQSCATARYIHTTEQIRVGF